MFYSFFILRDSDNDGISDAFEAGATWPTVPIDTDGDGLPDYRDVDSDGDGISDAEQKGPSTCCLGNGATPAGVGQPIDTDGDAIPDYKDDDSDNDGISFWANNDGSGFFRLWEVGGSIFKTIQPDFGSQSIVNFTVVHTLDVPEHEVDLGYHLYPNPSTGQITVDGGDMQGAVPTLYNSMGQEINAPSQRTESTLTYDLENFPSGIYYLSIVKNGYTWTQKVVKH